MSNQSNSTPLFNLDSGLWVCICLPASIHAVPSQTPPAGSALDLDVGLSLLEGAPVPIEGTIEP